MLKNLVIFFRQPHSRVIGLTFFSMSILFGSWVSRIPEVQNKLALSDSSMALAILCMGIGAFVISPLSGFIFAKLDLPKAIFVGVFAMSVAIVSLILVNSFISLSIFLFLLGLSQGFLNIAQNTAASAIEKESQRTIMSTCHGMFSVGAMIGAGFGSLLVGMEVDGILHFVAMMILVLALAGINSKHIFTLPNAAVAASKFSWPPKGLWALIFIGICAMLAEGVVASWSGNYLEKTIGANGYLLGFGFAGFSAFMALGRLFGDEVIPKVGSDKALLISLLIGSLGIALAGMTSIASIALLGFSLAGLGFSVVVPIVFSAAGQTEEIAPSQAIAAVAGIGILGFLGGPPLIGVIADLTSMRTGMLLTAFISLLAVVIVLFRR